MMCDDYLPCVHSMQRRSAIALVATTAKLLLASRETDAERRPKTRTLTMSATAYCVRGETSTGTQVTSGTVAADPRVLPMGTTIRVTGLMSRRPQVFTVADTGPGVRGHEIDIFIADCARARVFGRRKVQVRVLTLPATVRSST
jgi:3D (Asp-Asp-Asp) domain-containing protein